MTFLTADFISFDFMSKMRQYPDLTVFGNFGKAIKADCYKNVCRSKYTHLVVLFPLSVVSERGRGSTKS